MAIEFKDKSQVLTSLQSNSSEKKNQISNYEDQGVFELAYLIKWQIVEETVKEIAIIQRRDNLLKSLKLWIDYLEDAESKKPKDIKNFNLDSKTLPQTDLIKNFFEGHEISSLADILDSDKKYRRRRNDISHRFDTYFSEKTYPEYSSKLDEAIKELCNALNS